MEALYLLAIASLTSLGLLWVGRRGLRLRTCELARACKRALDLVGAILIFWVLNVTAAVGAALLIRRLGLGFVSAYVGTDPTLLVVALLQALVFESWRAYSSASSK